MRSILCMMVAVHILLGGALAYAEQHTSPQEMLASPPKDGRQQFEFSYPRHHGKYHGSHMFQLSEEAKDTSESWWDIVVDYVGNHGSCGRPE